MVRQILGDADFPSRTLHEYLILPGKISAENTLDKIDISTPLVKFARREKPRIKLNTPILSAAMQSVTGSKMAIEMASLGGAGVIYCSQPIEEEAKMVKEVKRFKAGFVAPDVLSPEDPIKLVVERVKNKGYSTFPITVGGTETNLGKFVGLLTKDDFDSERHQDFKVESRMIPAAKINVAYEDEIRDESGKLSVGKANDILVESHQGYLPILDRVGNLLYVVFKKDIEDLLKNPLGLVDGKGRFVVGAAINTHDYEKRVPALVEAEADFLVIDTSQGYSEYVLRTLEFVKKNYQIPVIGGNIVTAEGFRFLVENGADAVKVGMGSGSICITQEVKGVGRAQAKAVFEVGKERQKYFQETGIYVPIISDGGILTAKDMLVALVLFADAVMVGRRYAGTDESPTLLEIGQNEKRIKHYWGEGASRARQWAPMRYQQSSFEEGKEIEVEYIGPLGNILGLDRAKIKDGIRASGWRNIAELQENADLEMVSQVAESISEKKISSTGKIL